MKKSTKIIITIASVVLVLLIINLANGWTVEFQNADNLSVEYGDTPALPTAAFHGKFLFPDGFSLPVTADREAFELGDNACTYETNFLFLHKKTTRTVTVTDTTAPLITLVTKQDGYTIPGEKYAEEGYTATDNYDGDLTAKVNAEYLDDKVIYTVSDSCGNTAVLERTIVYFDPIAPVITLTGLTEVTIDIGQTYEEEGFTATDNCDGDLTKNVTVTKNENEWIYTVADSYNNIATATRTLRYVDMSAPELTLIGAEEMTIYLGDEYEEAGCTAFDIADGDLTAQVIVSSSVDSSTAGTYEVNYTVTDAAGNTAQAIRKVKVLEYNIPALEEAGKVIYLTFDDGPCGYTTDLLNVLDKYNVKVTFFVTKNNKNATALLQDIYSRGHSIGIHTVSHEYDKIYQSEEAFLEDLYSMQDFIYEATGYRTMLSRFPGGSSNTISKKYCVGIMTTLVQTVREAGFQYFDWNVSSGDATGKPTTTAEVVKNVINGVKGKKVSVVLQHDIKKFSVDAVEEIIQWGLENGYTFLPLTIDSFAAHHGVNN